MQDFSNPGAALRGPTPTNEYRFSFTGTAGEYFPIWLVNISLTIVTLGIYGAWAKVRRERYFHGHTAVAGSSFEYTADPVKILIGRLILFVFMLTYSFSSSLFPPVAVIISLVILAMIPWIMTQALRFRARYTTYRNLSFAFTGTYMETLIYFWILKAAAILTLGLLLPFAKQQERDYLVRSLRYGRTAFSLNAPLWEFIKAYLLAFALFLTPIIMVSSLDIGSAITDMVSAAKVAPVPADSKQVAAFFFGSFLALAFAIPMATFALRVRIAQITWNNAAIGDFKLEYSVTLGRYLWIASSNLILRLVTLGLAAPYCAIRMHRYKVENLALVGPQDPDAFLAVQQAQVNAAGGEIADAYDWDIDLGF